MIKKITLMMLVAMLSVVMVACSNNSSNSSNSSVAEPTLSAKEMIDKMVEEVEQPAFMELSEEEVKTVYNVDVDKLEDYSIRIPLMNVKAHEISILKVKDSKDIAEIEELLKQRAETVQKSFETYLPDQLEIAQNYKIVTKGNYIIFIISDQVDELLNIYDGFFEQK